MVKRDRVVGFVFLLMGLAVIFYGLGDLGMGTLKAPGSGFFPVISGACIAVFSGIWLISIRKEQSEEDSPFWEKGEWIRPTFAVLITMGYAAIMDDFGFILSTFLFIATWQFCIEHEKWIRNMVISLVGTASMYMIFQILLSVPLPRGMFSL